MFCFSVELSIFLILSATCFDQDIFGYQGHKAIGASLIYLFFLMEEGGVFVVVSVRTQSNPYLPYSIS